MVSQVLLFVQLVLLLQSSNLRPFHVVCFRAGLHVVLCVLLCHTGCVRFVVFATAYCYNF